jgi:RNA polymerase sigma factor (sigma-70 family)
LDARVRLALEHLVKFPRSAIEYSRSKRTVASTEILGGSGSGLLDGTLLARPTSDGTDSDPILADSRSQAKAPADFTQRIGDEIPFLRRAARRWHREKADIDDLVQDTVVQALANAHLWQPGTDLRGWLYTIMRNRFLAGATRSNRSAAALQQMAADQPRPAAGSSELRLILRDLYAALRRLPSNQRSAVLLIGVEGKSYDEAAQTMGTSIGAVRSHLARGRDRLRTAVQGTDARPPFTARLTVTAPAAVPPATGTD